jgi:hypothetical protein
VLAAADKSLRIRFAAGVLTIAAVITGGLIGGVDGAAWALIAGPALTVVLSWRSFGAALRPDSDARALAA